MLEFILNGKALCIGEGMTIKELLAVRGLDPETLIVEHNGELVRKEMWGGIILKENDSLEILRFVGGG